MEYIAYKYIYNIQAGISISHTGNNMAVMPPGI